MGIISKAIGLTGWTTLAVTGTWIAFTRKNRIVPVPASDYIFKYVDSYTLKIGTGALLYRL
jgi:hypothetical protein